MMTRYRRSGREEEMWKDASEVEDGTALMYYDSGCHKVLSGCSTLLTNWWHELCLS